MLRRGPARLLAAAALLAAALSAAAAGSGAATTRVSWRSHPALPGVRDAEALAFDPASGRIAIGDARGVWLVAGEGAPRRLLGRGPVRDLMFRPGGELLAATDRGLFGIAAEGPVRFLRLASGKASRVRRLAGSGTAVAAGTEDGVFLALDGASFARLSGGLPSRPVDALALRPADAGLELGAALAGTLQRATVRTGADGVLRVEAQNAVIADSPAARGTVDLAADLAGAELVALSAQHVALRSAGSWRSVALELPAGARARRLGSGSGRLWIATDGGIVEARRWEGPWRRAHPPAGLAPSFAFAGDEERILALGSRGLLEGRRGAGGVVPPGERAAPGAGSLAPDDYLWRLRSEPSIQQVHGAALRWLELGPERMASLRRGVDRRGWLPDLLVRGGAGRGRSHRLLEDQTQSSGVVYDLFDREFDRATSYDAGIVLEWSLGDLVYHPEALDVARESREVIELRDEVLDEVTQLYFERRRTLLALRASAADPAELARLRLRADELAAGLDAWTGGFFSRHAPPLAAVASSLSPLP
jgi:hypothetical protein